MSELRERYTYALKTLTYLDQNLPPAVTGTNWAPEIICYFFVCLFCSLFFHVFPCIDFVIDKVNFIYKFLYALMVEEGV